MNFIKGDFAVVPNLQAAMELKSPASNVYLALCKFSDKDGGCWPSVPTIAKAIDMSERSVQIGLKALVEYGMLTVDRRKRPDGSAASNRYQIVLRGVVQDTAPGGEVDCTPLTKPKNSNQLLRKAGEPAEAPKTKETPLKKEIYQVFRHYSLVVGNNAQVPGMCKKLIDAFGEQTARLYLVRLVERDLRTERDAGGEFVPQLGNWRDVTDKAGKIVDYFKRTKDHGKSAEERPYDN